MLKITLYTLNESRNTWQMTYQVLAHIEVLQGREDLDEVSLSLGGPFANTKHPKHFAALNCIHVTDVWEVEGVFQQGGLNPEEVNLQVAIFPNGNHLPNIVHHLL